MNDCDCNGAQIVKGHRVACPEHIGRCPDCFDLVFTKDSYGVRPGEDAAWKNHFAHCRAHLQRIEFEEPHATISILTFKFHRLSAPDITLYARQYVDFETITVSDAVWAWSADGGYFMLDDWRVDDYAPVPF